MATPAALAQLTGLVAANHDHTIAEHQQRLRAAGFGLSAATVGQSFCVTEKGVVLSERHRSLP